MKTLPSSSRPLRAGSHLFFFATLLLLLGGDFCRAGFVNSVETTPNLLGYWRFSAASQANSEVNGYTGIFQGNAQVGAALSGPTLQDEQGNSAVLLDGSGDFVTTSLTGQISSQGTIVAWFYLTTLPSTANRNFIIADASLNGDDFGLQIETDNRIRFYTDSNGHIDYPVALTAADLNQWHFVAATFTAGTTRSIYFDGKLVGTGTAGGHSLNTGATFAIGDSVAFPGRVFQGRLDEVAVFNRDLTSAEVSAIYQSTKLALVAHWKFDEIGGTIARDTTGAFPGTLAGGAAFLCCGGGGISGSAVSLDIATNSRVNVGTSFPGFTSGDFSFVAWVKGTDTSLNRSVLTKHEPGTNGYLLETQGGTGKATLVTSEDAALAPTSTTVVTDGQWHQLVGVYHAGGLHSIYVDGSPAETSVASPAVVANAAPFLIGGVGTGGAVGDFTGLIDDVQVYRGALTDAEIDFLYGHPGQDLAQIPTPIAHYKFDEANGTTAKDSIGTADGTLSAAGSSFVSGGISGNAISLNRAANGFVNMGDNFGMTSGDFSLSFWVKTTTTEQDILAVSKHRATITAGYLVAINPTGGGGANNKALFYASDAQTAQSPTSTTSVNDGQWHHLVGVYHAGGMHSVYVDGSPAEASTTSQTVNAIAAPFLVGGVDVAGTPTSRYTGLIDDMQVFDVALTDSQIDYIYAHPGQSFGNAIYDLATDWSDVMNPNCTWTYREGGNALPHVASWQRTNGGWTSAQPGWARSEDGNDRIPFWFKSNGTENLVHDWLPGDIVVHVKDDISSVGNGNANVIWTSPFNGTINVSGGVWMGADLGRGSDWFLSKNGTLLTQGHIDDGDPYSRANPFPFSAGSGGAGVLSGIDVAVGDVIKLEFVKTSTFGYFVGVNMTITGGPVIQPEATTAAATNVTGRSAGFNGTINPNGFPTSYYFELGSTTAYGFTTQSFDAGAGTAPVPVGVTLFGGPLNFATTYHYRLVATSNGCVYRGNDVTFTTPPPPTLSTTAASGIGVTRATLNGTINPMGAPATYHFAYGKTAALGTNTPDTSAGSGTSDVNVSAVVTGLDPGTTYFFRLVVVSGFTTFTGSTLNFDTTNIVPGIFAVAARDDAAPGAAGATFFKFGPPAINDAAHFAFRGTLTSGGNVSKTNDSGLWAEIGGTLALVAREGEAAPGAPGAFAKFGDPVFARGDRVAFIGKIKPGPNTTGIWSHIGSTLTLIARQGDPAPGTTATYASFVSLGLTETGGPVFLAKLKGATPATDVGIFAANAAGVVQPVLVRKGDKPGGVTQPITALQFLPPVKIVGGQTRGFNADGHLTFRATFKDKSAANFFIVGNAINVLASTAGGLGTPVASLGAPTISSGDIVTFLCSLPIGAGVTKDNDAAIIQLGGTDAIPAREGDGAAAKFASFSDPVANAAGAVAFLAKLKPGTGGVSSADAAGIWSNAQGALTLLARQGSPAPGAPAGALFSKFTALALPNTGDAIFLAKLKHSAAVKKAGDTGIWAADAAGTVSLVTRTGDALTVGAGAKTVRLLQFLPTLRGVPGQTRNFNDDGFLAFRAVFTDQSEAIFKVVR